MKFNFEINKNLNNLLLQLVVLIQFKIKENLTKEELRHPSNIFNIQFSVQYIKYSINLYRIKFCT